MKLHEAAKINCNVIDEHIFKYILRDYVHSTLTDTILDQYVHADSDESLNLDIEALITVDKRTLSVHKIYIEALYEIYDFADFKNEFTVQLSIDDRECDTLLLKTDFDFSKLTYRATADAAEMIASIKRCLAAHNVTVQADAFARHDLNTL